MNRMNKKGATLGAFIIIFIGIIVALALFNATVDPIAQMTNTYSATNHQVTSSATPNGTITLPGRENVTAVTAVNANGTATTYFTIVNTNSEGNLAILLKTSDKAVTAAENGTLINVTYTYKPDGYNDGSGARGIWVITLIMSAIAIAIFVVPGFKDMF